MSDASDAFLKASVFRMDAKNTLIFKDCIWLSSALVSLTRGVPCELRAPEDFLKRRYNLLDMSGMRVAYYGLDSGLFSL